jgi:hypothetical protein
MVGELEGVTLLHCVTVEVALPQTVGEIERVGEGVTLLHCVTVLLMLMETVGVKEGEGQDEGL